MSQTLFGVEGQERKWEDGDDAAAQKVQERPHEKRERPQPFGSDTPPAEREDEVD